MVEFLGEKIKPPRSSKPFEHMQIYIRSKDQLWGIFSFEQGKLQITQPRYAKNVKENLVI